MTTSGAPSRAAPPPFSRQRARSRLVLASLVLAVLGVLAAGTLITLPTHVSAPATVSEPARCVGIGAPVGPAGCVLVRVDPRWAGRLPQEVPARLLAADGGIVGVGLSAASPAADGPVLAAALDTAPVPGALTAVADVGHRRLGLVFLGQGLEARP